MSPSEFEVRGDSREGTGESARNTEQAMTHLHPLCHRTERGRGLGQLVVRASSGMYSGRPKTPRLCMYVCVAAS